MTTLATIALPVADSWTVSVGGGWIVVMLMGMGLCFVGMFAFMWLMGGGQSWPICNWFVRDRTDSPGETALTILDRRRNITPDPSERSQQ